MADQSPRPLSIVLVRHGETEWSRSGRHTSYTDVVLTDVGREQAVALRARLASIAPLLVLASARTRAIETCELAGFRGRVEIDDDLAEWDYGEYEGLTTAEICRTVPGWTIFTHGALGGETPEQVGRRADRVIARALAAGGTVLLFSHAHFLRVLGARWVGLDPIGGQLLALDTATVSTLGHEREQRVVRTWNT